MKIPVAFGVSVAAAPSPDLMTVVLDDLRCVVIRLIRDDDAPRLQRLHTSLSERTNRLRFFAFVPELSDQQAAHFAGVDHDDREAIVGEVDGEIIAVARYDRLDTPEAAEIALLVRDDFQHHRLGTILLGELVALATSRGITRFIAQTLIERPDVLHAMRAIGLECTSRDSRGVRTITGRLT